MSDLNWSNLLCNQKARYIKWLANNTGWSGIYLSIFDVIIRSVCHKWTFNCLVGASQFEIQQTLPTCIQCTCMELSKHGFCLILVVILMGEKEERKQKEAVSFYQSLRQWYFLVFHKMYKILMLGTSQFEIQQTYNAYMCTLTSMEYSKHGFVFNFSS